MTPEEAAQAVFPSLARSLQKFLRVTRQQPRHSAEQVVRHLAQFLSFDMSPKAFLERFFNTQELNEVKISFICQDRGESLQISFRLRWATSSGLSGVTASLVVHCAEV